MEGRGVSAGMDMVGLSKAQRDFEGELPLCQEGSRRGTSPGSDSTTLPTVRRPSCITVTSIDEVLAKLSDLSGRSELLENTVDGE